jgi:hypothetical protein
MRKQDDEQLRGWAHQIAARLTEQGCQAAYLVWHGAPGSAGASTAHAEDTHNGHVLEIAGVTVDDLNRLREFLPEFGVGDVTVKQANAGGGRIESAEVPPPEGGGKG